MEMQKHKFPYNWRLSEAKFTKDKGKVFSCFACGGGSTMGYKLAGFDVIGCNEIDPKMMKCYIENHNPQYTFLEDIRNLLHREDLPEELYNLTILQRLGNIVQDSLLRLNGVPKKAAGLDGMAL